MASLLDDLELGAAGVTDKVLGTKYAASVYANQTAAATGQDVTVLESQAVQAEDAGAVDRAAKLTEDQVGEKLDALGGYVKWIVVGAVAIALIVALVELGPLLKVAKR